MGGLGSGRPSGSGRTTVEACRSVDVNRLQDLHQEIAQDDVMKSGDDASAPRLEVAS